MLNVMLRSRLKIRARREVQAMFVGDIDPADARFVCGAAVNHALWLHGKSGAEANVDLAGLVDFSVRSHVMDLMGWEPALAGRLSPYGNEAINLVVDEGQREQIKTCFKPTS
jgi:hypothetical protein